MAFEASSKSEIDRSIEARGHAVVAAASFLSNEWHTRADVLELAEEWAGWVRNGVSPYAG